MRINKFIANTGYCSRRKADLLLEQGKVFVNGNLAEKGMEVSEQDEITVEGNKIALEEVKRYYLLNKPIGYSSTAKAQYQEKIVLDLIDSKERIYPVGRLDKDSFGLLLLTNDGDFANAMMHPSSHLPKTYEVAVTGVLTDDMLNRLAKGIMLSDGKTLPAEVVLLERSTKKNKTVLHITIQEGRNREVRRMMEYFHCEVTRLNRIGYGFLDLGNLRQGQYRKLRSFEVRKLLAMVKHSTED